MLEPFVFPIKKLFVNIPSIGSAHIVSVLLLLKQFGRQS